MASPKSQTGKQLFLFVWCSIFGPGNNGKQKDNQTVLTLSFLISESSRGGQLRDILCHLQLDQRCDPKDVAKIINLSYFNENYETVHYLAMTMAKMLLQ